MTKRWRFSPHDSARVAGLERAAGVPSVVAQLLILRGVQDAATARLFLDAKLTGVEPARVVKELLV